MGHYFLDTQFCLVILEAHILYCVRVSPLELIGKRNFFCGFPNTPFFIYPDIQTYIDYYIL